MRERGRQDGEGLMSHPYDPGVHCTKEAGSLGHGRAHSLTAVHQPAQLESTEVGVNGKATAQLGGERRGGGRGRWGEGRREE